ncbi:MAG TPA: PilW family protein [Rhodocyclaceae bacterium]
MTIGLVMLLGVTMVFVSSSETRTEVDKAGRQIENGRFATESIKEDIQLAGFYGNLVPASTTTWTTPDPCISVDPVTGAMTATATADLQTDFNGASSPVRLPVTIYGYENYSLGPPATATASCVHNRKPGTDMLVTRRVSTAEIDLAGGAATAANDFYLQVSACSDTPSEASFLLDKTQANFTLHKVKPVGTPATCLSGDKAPVNKYIQHIYYISTCNDCRGSGDGVPTLKMIELPGASGSVLTGGACATGETPPCPIGVAEGIEDIRFEYGVDPTGSGTPASYAVWSATTDWKNVIAVKMFLLARNTETTSNFTDSKTYSLSSDGALINSGAAFGDHYKRHVYTLTARAYNLADRR